MIILLGLVIFAIVVLWIMSMIGVREDKNKIVRKTEYQIFKENKLSK